MIRTIGIPGVPFEANQPVTLTNKTAATTSEGSIGFLDEAQADADSTTLALGLSNVVAASTALMAYGHAVLAKGAYADDADGLFEAGEGVRSRIRVNSTTDIAKGDVLKPVNGQNYAVKATKGTDRWIAVALEARTSDDAGVIECVLYSRGKF